MNVISSTLSRIQGEARGRLFTLVGVMILSFDSLLVRLIDSEEWTLIFWRGLLPAIVFYLAQWKMDNQVLKAHFFHPKISTLLTASLFSASTICFVFSLDHTEVTSTLVITNTAPLITAVLGFFFLKETLNRSTIVAIIISVGGIWLVFGYQPNPAELEGDSLALVTAVSMSVYMIMLRKTQARYATVFLIYSGIFTAIIALIAGAKPFSLPPISDLYIVLLCGVVLPCSFLLINVGPRYLPAAEASLILLLEVLFGPLLVWLILGEMPAPAVALGAGIIVVTLAGHTIWSQRKHT
ncbi:DMT family transporter [Enterovibrio makurazakiensis]|uniref:DMT family transporter n=1 Tax=Enterovibrio gelatinilyticus TaxID=2899819 RepID=A0ABT5R5D9_9GAMM|nr:DMT family transporter [Enterovibrio sp. ZSDZ42]MDD1795484.1 DMT family transporter [Enterovibrio sp. ZSDZ42]